jgi:bifunctional non-homologous end joining protein LigD
VKFFYIYCVRLKSNVELLRRTFLYDFQNYVLNEKLVSGGVLFTQKYDNNIKMENLSDYGKKRNFEKTSEPKSERGNEKKTGGRLSYVIQHHMAHKDHFDFRLEWDGALLSWAVPKGPSFNPQDKRLAIRVEDHPLEYRHFEGTIPKGQYGGGTVMLWDEGYWEPLGDVGKNLNEGNLKFVIYGKRLKGKWALVRMKQGDDKKENWLLLKEEDEYAKTDSGITEFTASAESGREMSEIENGETEKKTNPIENVDVQLAKLVNSIPETGEWLYEVKYDGYRIIAFVENNKATLLSRNKNDVTGKFSVIASSLVKLASGRAMVLDGEMAITDAEGKTDFQALQNYLRKPDKNNLTYIVFDLLALDGEDLRREKLIDRKKKLDKLMENAPVNIICSKYIEGNGAESFCAACKLHLEGIVGKKADSVYSGTRNGDWIKLKCENRQEFVIGGLTKSAKKQRDISSVMLGLYDGKNLIYCGRAGTGFNSLNVKELGVKTEKLIRKTSPFYGDADIKEKDEEITWLEPKLVAEIKFAEWTDKRLLRQASYKGLRMDKEAKDLETDIKNNENAADTDNESSAPRLETAAAVTADISEVRVTNPDKIIYKSRGIKKIDVVSYYAHVAERMFPYAGDRLLSLVRCPDGVGGQSFFKKHPGTDKKGITAMPIKTGGGEEEYFYIGDAEGFALQAQMDTIEFHAWGSRVDSLEKPDMMVFDLDPDINTDLDKVRKGAENIKKILDDLSLVSFLKTSGGKGYHVVVPFEPETDWDGFRDFAKRVAVVMESEWPELYTSNIRKEKRKGKIFIDWIRNSRGATSVAPYSLRAREGAAVSMPIFWEELYSVSPSGIKMEDALKRIGGVDPWKDFYSIGQKLKR